MRIGEALDALQAGRRVQLPGGDPNVWIALIPGFTVTIAAGRPLGLAAPELIGRQVAYSPHIDIHCADGTIAPWSGPTMANLFSDDWQVL